MKTSLSARVCAIGFWLFAFLPAVMWAQVTGVVRGQVSNHVTKAYLQNAVVTVEGSERSATTDQQGTYELMLPAGEARLKIVYPGLDAQTVNVSVAAGRTVVRDIELTAGIYRMDAYTVAGVREGNAKAIAMQEQAPNVKNVVASDSIGNVADGNVGDFMQQLPGVNAVYVGADVRAIQIRGIAEQLNSVTMDGTRLASAPSNATDRTFEFEQLSLNLIETIELTKSPTPDMDADSIGGSVNVVSKSAFDRAQPKYLTYSIGGVYRPKYYTRSPDFVREPLDHIGPSINLGYSDVFGANRNVGVLLNFTYHSQPGGDTAALMNYENAVKPARYIYNVQVPRPAGAPRTRLSLGAKIDFKASDSTVFTLNTFSNWFHENNDTRIFSNLTSQSTANFVPGYTATFQEVIANANSAATTLTTTDDKFGRTVGAALSARHRYPGLEIDYGINGSNSLTQWEMGPNTRKSPFGSPLGHTKGQVNATLSNVGYTIDRRNSLQWPVVTQTAGLDWYDLNNYRNLALLHNDRGAIDTVMQGQFNLKKQFTTRWPTFVKTGAQYREQRRRNWNAARDYVFLGDDGIAGNAEDSLGQFLDRTNQWHDSNAGYRTPPWFSSYLVAEDQKANPQRWRENIANTASRYYSTKGREGIEDVFAAYAMGNVKLGGVSILAGVRMENTVVKAAGPRSYVSPEETARRNAYNAANPVVSDAETIRRWQAQYSTLETTRGEYTKLFPGVHVKYQPRALPGVTTRASYSSSVGRPSFQQIIPITNAVDSSRTVSTANPSLRPQFSNNFDVTLEYYFNPAGFVTAGVFLKEIDDFIFNRTKIVGSGPDNGFDGMFEGYTWTSPDNAGRGRYRGFEIAYNQQFTFLPGFWRGFSLGLNYTKTESYGDFGAALASSLVAKVVPNMANLNLNYRYRKIDVRLTGIWRDEYLLASNASLALLQWQQPKWQFNLKTRYTVSQRFGFFLDIENFNRSPITESYQGPKGTGKLAANQTRIVEPKFIGGITGRF